MKHFTNWHSWLRLNVFDAQLVGGDQLHKHPKGRLLLKFPSAEYSNATALVSCTILDSNIRKPMPNLSRSDWLVRLRHKFLVTFWAA